MLFLFENVEKALLPSASECSEFLEDLGHTVVGKSVCVFSVDEANAFAVSAASWCDVCADSGFHDAAGAATVAAGCQAHDSSSAIAEKCSAHTVL